MYSQLVIDLLKSDSRLRMLVALAINVSEQAVLKAANAGSTSITKYDAVRVIREYTGYTDDQMFEHEKAQ